MSILDLWICTTCGYIYDPYIGDSENGINAGTPFLDLTDEWTCPCCGAEKNEFVPYYERAQYGISEGIEA
jgi:rubredoxin